MKALILAGGLGTRLRPLTRNLPKPMVPIVNRPLLEHTILLLKKHNINEVIFLLYYLSEVITDHFENASEFGVKMSYITADDDYATSGAVKLASEFVDDTFLVVSGDVITDLNISDFVKFHSENNALASVALSTVPNPSPFGIAVTDSEYKITQFLEKPSPGQIFSHRVNMGVYLLEPEIFDWIPEKQEHYFAKDLFLGMVKRNAPIFGFSDDCYWLDVGDLPSYRQVHWDFFEKKISLAVNADLKDGIWQGKNCCVGRDVKIEGNVVLGDNCRVDDRVLLHNSIIGNNCRINRNSSLVNTILWDNVEVGENCKFDNNVADRGLRIASRKFMNANSFVFD